MKKYLASAVFAAAMFIVACGADTGQVNNHDGIVPEWPGDFSIVTIDWRGMKCDIAYVYVTAGAYSGGPAMTNLGCY